MPTKPTTQVRSANSQKDQRWAYTVYDQHTSSRFPRGRPWWGVVEYASDRALDASFVGNLMPGDSDDPMNSSWDAPWMPDAVKSWNNVGTYRLDLKRQRITWLYPAIIAADKLALEEYYHKAATIAYEKGWPAPKLGEPVPYQIRQILYSPPRSPKIAEAAMAGDQWLLGFSSQVNEDLQALLQGIRPDTTLPPVATAAPDLQALIAEGIKAARAQEKQENAAKAEKMRAGKKGKAKPSAPAEVAA